MAKPIPLDEQIVATLSADCTSEQAAAVLSDAKRELADLTRRADAADVASLNPMATTAEARKLRTEAGDHRFEADRMEASVSALETRLSEIQSAEQSAARAALEREILIERDALAADIAREYPRIVGTLTSLAKRIVENDERLERAGLRSERSAELIGRNIAGHYVNHTPVHRISSIKIEMPQGERMAWDAGIEGWRWRGLACVEKTRA